MIHWRKSSHSQGGVNSECVEVSTNLADTTLIRDSKDSHGPRLILTRDGFTDLLKHIKAGGMG
ncbi:DUF397 domain-containing protein [Actinomadura sp. 9N407]|uniref:DUF397 domain-containing protein n=1 Tax=Actinomadura sp. 9N407 TaxID=3375154 RepID=UPI0037A79637